MQPSSRANLKGEQSEYVRNNTPINTPGVLELEESDSESDSLEEDDDDDDEEDESSSELELGPLEEAEELMSSGNNHTTVERTVALQAKVILGYFQQRSLSTTEDLLCKAFFL